MTSKRNTAIEQNKDTQHEWLRENAKPGKKLGVAATGGVVREKVRTLFRVSSAGFLGRQLRGSIRYGRLLTGDELQVGSRA